MLLRGPLNVVLADPKARDRGRIKRLASMYRSVPLVFLEADTGRATLDLLEHRAAECLLLCDTLPDMDAVELIERIVGKQIAVPTIILATRNDPAQAERARAVGAVAYLVKRDLTSHSISRELDYALTYSPTIRLQMKQIQKDSSQRDPDVHASPQPATSADADTKEPTSDAGSIRLRWSLSGRWREGRGRELSMLGLCVEDIAAPPPEGATVSLSLDLLRDCEPLEVCGEVIRLTPEGGFKVAFVGLGRRDKVLLRNAAARTRRVRSEPSEG